MKAEAQTQKNSELHVLLMGNNPIDMSSIKEKLGQIRNTKVITEIAFDVKSLLERLMNFKPNYILIDDNIGKLELAQAVNALSQKNTTRNIPIAVLKNSNYQESYAANTVLDYLLKNNLSSDRLYNTLRNSIRLRKTQAFLHKAYSKKKQLLSAFF